MRVDGQEPDRRRACRLSGRRTAKAISIKGAMRRFGDCARKAAGLTPGDLRRVVIVATEIVGRDRDVNAVESMQPCCVRDEGRSLGIGLQDQVPNHLKLLGPKAPVVSVQEKAGREPVRCGPRRRTQVNRR